MADDVSIGVGWRTDVSKICLSGGPAWRYCLRISPVYARIEVINANDADWAAEEGLSGKNLLFAIYSVTFNITMCNDLWGKDDSS